jgi:hypothetical protein
VYLTAIVLTMLVLPIASIVIEAAVMHAPVGLLVLVGKWFVFWACGVRLFLAGVKQTMQPRFTAETIFEIKDPAAQAIVREVGFGNLAIGTLGLCSLANANWVVPAAIVGGLYYGLAGVGHLIRPQRNFIEQTALISDLLAFLLLAVVVAYQLG